MSSEDDAAPPQDQWRIQGRVEREASGAPSPAESLLTELDRIQVRLNDVIEQGRPAFFEGSDSYDRATVAVIRLAALFEEPSRFAPLLTAVTLDERRGIITTRNIAAHSGYRAMDANIFWQTTTAHLPGVIARLRAGVESAP
ncbi:antitoxin [Brachybacterium epidermidis]|uniref:antitoxin n=1 Tax=Brachybacterium epidermidis TaxID=2781983 RepID=UPI00398F5EBC